MAASDSTSSERTRGNDGQPAGARRASENLQHRPTSGYSFRVGRMTAVTKWAKCEAPSSSWSQRTTQ